MPVMAVWNKKFPTATTGGRNPPRRMSATAPSRPGTVLDDPHGGKRDQPGEGRGERPRDRYIRSPNEGAPPASVHK
jgi:hypothetical protein